MSVDRTSSPKISSRLLIGRGDCLRHFFVALKSGLSEQEKNNFLINLHDLIVYANQLTTTQFEKVTGSLYEMLKLLVEKSVPRRISPQQKSWTMSDPEVRLQFGHFVDEKAQSFKNL